MYASTLAPMDRAGTGLDPAAPLPVKVVVLGGRAVGRTRVSVEDSFVTAVSELHGGASVLPYGRCAVTDRLSVHLYGMPAQERYWFMWDSVRRGAVAALVLADGRRLADCFGAIDYAERSGVPYLVAVANAGDHSASDVRDALSVPGEVPVLLTGGLPGPERPRAARDLLHALVRYAVTRRYSTVPAA